MENTERDLPEWRVECDCGYVVIVNGETVAYRFAAQHEDDVCTDVRAFIDAKPVSA